MTTSSSAAPAAEELVRERDRVVHRLRSMALGSLPVERVHAAAQELADLAADAGDGARRTVPVLGPHAAGDQVAVLTREVELAAAGAGDGGGDGGELLARATQVLAGLRRDLSAPRPG
jgi:hypothetical protein